MIKSTHSTALNGPLACPSLPKNPPCHSWQKHPIPSIHPIHPVGKREPLEERVPTAFRCHQSRTFFWVPSSDSLNFSSTPLLLNESLTLHHALLPYISTALTIASTAPSYPCPLSQTSLTTIHISTKGGRQRTISHNRYRDSSKHFRADFRHHEPTNSTTGRQGWQLFFI